MDFVLLNGKEVANSIYARLALELSLLPQLPKIVFVMVGDDPASATYVRSKAKKCQDLGLRSETIHFPTNISESEFFLKLKSLNRDKDVHGILVQLPLPAQLEKQRVVCEIDPLKDVDGLHPENIGRLVQGFPRFVPCTPAGILEILKFYSVPLESSKVVIVGRSDIVGKPLAQLLLLQNATITVCHSRTRDLAQETARADILVAALGKPKFIRPEFVKSGAVVIDVGIHREENRIVGDVDYDAILPKVRMMTPVPGGVGPMTIAMLMKNLLTAARLQMS